jgi:hypothetical protein
LSSRRKNDGVDLGPRSARFGHRQKFTDDLHRQSIES